MIKIKTFADRRPLMFAILLIPFWILAGGAFVALSAALTGGSMLDPLSQTLGRLFTTIILMLLAWSLGWLRASGIGRVGNWKVWAAALGLIVFIACAELFAFFGGVSFDFRIFAHSAEARSLLLQELLVGVAEETFFRGVMLYALVRVWGGTKPGLFGGVGISAFLFGLPHLMYLFFDPSPGDIPLILLNAAGTVISGAYYAAFVLWGRSVWPVVLLHGISNAVVLVNMLERSSINPPSAPYLRLMLFDLLPLLIGVWLLIRMPQVETIPEAP